jgi:hypothetical protein
MGRAAAEAGDAKWLFADERRRYIRAKRAREEDMGQPMQSFRELQEICERDGWRAEYAPRHPVGVNPFALPLRSPLSKDWPHKWQAVRDPTEAGPGEICIWLSDRLNEAFERDWRAALEQERRKREAAELEAAISAGRGVVSSSRDAAQAAASRAHREARRM